MKIPYNILIQIKMSVRPYFKGFTLIFSSITVENRSIACTAFNFNSIFIFFLVFFWFFFWFWNKDSET